MKINKSNNLELSTFELGRMKNLQKALLPRSCPHCKNMPVAANNIMKDHIGGDFYDFTRPDLCHWGFFVGDATGHGLLAAGVAATTYGLMQHMCEDNNSPADVLLKLNKSLFALNNRVKEIPFPFSASSFYSILDLKTGSLNYANAGHPAPILIDKETGKSKFLEPTGTPMGFSKEWAIQEVNIPDVKGTKLVIYTDGIIADGNSGGFDIYELKEYIETLYDKTSKGIVDSIINESKKRVKGKYTDDVTVIAVDLSLIDLTCDNCIGDPEDDRCSKYARQSGIIRKSER